VVLCVRLVTLPGAGAGIAFFLEPDFSKISAKMVTAALGQAFISLSLGMGAMITYGSYISHQVNLPKAAFWVTSLDTLIAVMAGFLILPAVFAFGFDPGAGPGLTFITLPAVFSQIPGGTVFGTLFFVLLAVAALTSAISLIEVVVAYLVDERASPDLGRPWARGSLFSCSVYRLRCRSAYGAASPSPAKAYSTPWIIWRPTSCCRRAVFSLRYTPVG